MSEYTVVVADTLRARFFSMERAKDPANESGPKLVEKEGLVNPEQEITKSNQAGRSLSGRTRSPSGGSYAFDDHRAKHKQDALRRFAKKVITRAIKQTLRQDARRCLVIAAEKKVLGALRAELATIKINGLEIRECDRDMAGETPLKIQALLARRDLVPALKKPGQMARKT